MAPDTRIRDLMKSRGWTQVEAAEQLGVTQSWISRVLNGHSRQLAIAAQVVARLDELERQAIAS